MPAVVDDKSLQAVNVVELKRMFTKAPIKSI